MLQLSGTQQCVQVLAAGPENGKSIALEPCDAALPEQGWAAVCSTARGSRGAGQVCSTYQLVSSSKRQGGPWCMDVKDGVKADGAMVFAYACHASGVGPGPNQLWTLAPPTASAGNTRIRSAMDGYCLGVEGAAALTIGAVLHESTVATVYVDGVFVALLNNEAHNGGDAVVAQRLPRALAGGRHTLAVLAAGLGLSADKAMQKEFLGLAALSVNNRTLPGPWTSTVGLAGEALGLPSAAGARAVQWGSPAATPPCLGDGSGDGAACWFEAEFDAPDGWGSTAGPEALAVDMTGATKGHIFVNGFDVGRYWVRSAVLSTYYQLPPDALLPRPHRNRLVIFEEQAVDTSMIRVVRRAD